MGRQSRLHRHDRLPQPGPDLIRRPVIAPQVYWTWSLVCRRGEERAAVLAVVDTLTDEVGDFGIHRPDAWLPDSDPHQQ
jgi:hypothetical protein